MADKPNKKKPAKKGKKPPDPLAYAFRYLSLELRGAVQSWGEGTRRSENNALNVLIEEALRAKGLWPLANPPTSADDP